jgi:PP-loop superfamily ATP-utilizing enzyme
MTDPRHLGEVLTERLREIGPLAIAYSGGADSALVLAAAIRALGGTRVLAVTAVSESLASGELASARALADDLGARQLTVRTQELSRPGYRATGVTAATSASPKSSTLLRSPPASTATNG